MCKRYFGSNGAQTDALAYGTEPGASTDTQGYDGTAWSTRPSLATARAAQGSGGGNTGSSALTFALLRPHRIMRLREYNKLVEESQAKSLTVC